MILFWLRNLQKETFKGTVISTLSTVAHFLLAMLYSDGYWSLNEQLPSYLSSQNRICFPSFKRKDPYLRKVSLAFINSDQKWESPNFLSTLPMICPAKYLLRIIACHNLSLFINLNNHLLNRHWFWISRFWISRPPWSLGWHTILCFDNLHFFFWLSFCQKKPRTKVINFFQHAFWNFEEG
jgi:hypothetical protein